MHNLSKTEPHNGRRVCLMSAALIAIMLTATAEAAAPAPIQPLPSIRQAATNFATSSAQASLRGAARVKAGRLDPRLRLAPCGAPLEAFRPRGNKLLGNVTIGVRCAGPKLWTVYVPVRVSMPSPVLVATQHVARGESLRASHVRFEERDLATLLSGYLQSDEGVIGKRLKRPVSVGTVITPRMLAAPKLVRRGNRVTILVRGPGVEIRATGKALRDGARGDVVPVRNLSTKRLVEGTVDSAGVVMVQM